MKRSQKPSPQTLQESSGEEPGTSEATTTSVVPFPADSQGDDSVQPEGQQSSKSESQQTPKTTSRSQKSASGSRRRPKLERTTKRRVSIEDLDEEHFRYLWAAFRLGDFDELGFAGSEDKDYFAGDFFQFLQLRYDSAWVVHAPTNKGVIPVGLIFGKDTGEMLILKDFTWFSWASPRNRIEGVAHCLRHIRNAVVGLMYCGSKDREFFDYMKALGLLRQTGRLYDVLDEPVMLYQTRRSQWHSH